MIYALLYLTITVVESAKKQTVYLNHLMVKLGGLH